MTGLVVEIAEVRDVDLEGTGNFLWRVFGLAGVRMVGLWRGGWLPLRRLGSHQYRNTT